MAIKMVSGNDAVAYAALASGVKVICGYPGTPSSECIGHLIPNRVADYPGTHIEWSTNEKVASEIAATCAWAGKRALCTMKMSGLNVAWDSMLGISHSGVIGGMVVYVADDPGTSSGMCEQDSRGFALLGDMVMLEPGNVQEMYDMVKYAFDLSEQIQAPVFVRSVTNVAQSHAAIDIEDRVMPDMSVPVVKKNINKYAKAGAAMCMAQHQDAINALAKGAELIRAKGLNKVELTATKGGLGVITAGTMKSYLDEGVELAKAYGAKIDEYSVLKAATTVPYPVDELRAMIEHCDTLVVIEELEPFMEREVYVQAQMVGKKVRIVGKLDGTLSRIGSYNANHIAKALCAAVNAEFPEEIFNHGVEEFKKAIVRPITTCVGCPHRGTYMAINTSLKKIGLNPQNDVIVTGDIGCTILGMNPPFNTVWMEISMGASIPCAHGFKAAGIEKPIIATIGDSTFFHNGVQGLVNAIQHDMDITVIIMDNGWTGMTGQQINPNTAQDQQCESWKRVDLVNVVKGMGIETMYVVDPFNQAEIVAALDDCLSKKGLKVVVARRECAIVSGRRKVKYSKIHVDTNKCINCKNCMRITGCAAITPAEKFVTIDSNACNGCSLCSQVCPVKAIIKEEL